MPEWIPTASSAKGRLVFAALDAFAANHYDDVNVVDLAAVAGVTTGSLYHHFGNKAGLYGFVRADIERRVTDRLAGAMAARANDPPEVAAHLGLLVAFDYLVKQGYARLLAEPPPGREGDGLAAFLSETIDREGRPTARILLAAWRAALVAVLEGVPADDAWAAFAAFMPAPGP